MDTELWLKIQTEARKAHISICIRAQEPYSITLRFKALKAWLPGQHLSYTYEYMFVISKLKMNEGGLAEIQMLLPQDNLEKIGFELKKGLEIPRMNEKGLRTVQY